MHEMCVTVYRHNSPPPPPVVAYQLQHVCQKLKLKALTSRPFEDSSCFLFPLTLVFFLLSLGAIVADDCELALFCSSFLIAPTVNIDEKDANPYFP
eukprot:m.11154 g.11154  ORF g.11154 m.11154 type:complete len:96 (-) comp3789_c1_seq1:576-863(-)